MKDKSRARVVREGWTGRRRRYKCRNPECRKQFVHDGGRLPVGARYCLDCLQIPAIKEKWNAAWAKEGR